MTHEVKVKLISKLVARKDLEVEVKEDGVKLGTLLISQGNVEWKPARKSSYKCRLTWTKFARLMERRGTGIRTS